MRALYGTQRVDSSCGTDDTLRRSIDAYAAVIGRHTQATVRAALDAMARAFTDWPPSPVQLESLCNQYNRPEHVTVPMLERPQSVDHAGLAKVRAAIENGLQRGDGHDYMRWARVVGSMYAAQSLVDAARTDDRLREILRQHQADGFERVESEDARRWLRANHGG